MYFLAWLLLLAPVSAAWFAKADLCNPSGRAGAPFTGFRVLRRYQFGWPAGHHWQLVHCSRGRVDFTQLVPARRGGDYPWTQPLCVAPDQCYAAARTRRYAPRRLPLYPRKRLIGGLYSCAGSDSPDKLELWDGLGGAEAADKADPPSPGSASPTRCAAAVPVLPLYGDDSAQSFLRRDGRHIVQYVPFMSTPDVAGAGYAAAARLLGSQKWARGLRADERYEYTAADRVKPWSVTNRLVNRFGAALALSDRFLPWEFDAPARELGRERLRDRLRAYAGARWGDRLEGSPLAALLLL